MSERNEIKDRISSVKSTQKITRAMYLISASKSKKAKAQLEKVLPFFTQIGVTLSQILAVSGNIETPFIGEKNDKEKKELCLVLAADKGMAGGYNHNVINLLESETRYDNTMLWVAGMLGRNQIKRRGYNISPDFRYPVMNPSVYRARDITDLVVEQYLTGEYSRVNLIYTKMITPLKQEPTIIQLLPLKPEDLTGSEAAAAENASIDYEPDPTSVFDQLTPLYLKGVIYSALVEAFASEQHARMYAMDNATKSAADMIANLSLIYNRARQADITQEISEIVGGIPSE